MMFFFLLYLSPLLNFHVSLFRARGRIDECCDDKQKRHRKLLLQEASWLWNRLKREEHLSGLGCDEWFNKSDITTSAVAAACLLHNPFLYLSIEESLLGSISEDEWITIIYAKIKSKKTNTIRGQQKENARRTEINLASEWSDDVMELFLLCCERIFSRLCSSVLCLPKEKQTKKKESHLWHEWMRRPRRIKRIVSPRYLEVLFHFDSMKLNKAKVFRVSEKKME